VNLLIKVSSSVRVGLTNLLLVRLAMMAEFKASAKKLTILFTKGSSKMIFTTVMVGTFIPMAIITSATGLMESGLVGVNLSTSPEKSTKECGNTVNLSVVE